MNNLENKNITKFSGLPLKSLLILSKGNGPVNEKEQHILWKEIFYRYFTNGRQFNLYKVLENKHEYFALVIGHELNKQKIDIPKEHIQDFIERLLEFIDFMDKKVIENNLEFEWQLHELSGLENMMNEIKNSNISDHNLKQKINLFIDKMNNARKESLVKIKETKKNEIMVKEDNKSELMKQELKHLNIALSKATKSQYLEVLSHYNMYYPKDQKKIIRQGLRRFSYDLSEHQPWEAFVENLEYKRDGENLINYLVKSISKYYSQDNKPFDFSKVVDSGKVEDFVKFMENLFLSAEGGDKKHLPEFKKFLYKLLYENNIEKNLFKNLVLQEMKDFKKRIGHLLPLSKKLSETLTHKLEMDTNKSFRIMYDKSLNNWKVKIGQDDSKTVNVLEAFFNVFHQVNDVIFKYNGHFLENDSGEFELKVSPNEENDELVQFYCDFIPSIYIDNNFALYANEIYKGSFFFDATPLTEFFRYKFCRKSVSEQELKHIFLDRENYEVFKNHTSSRSYSGSYHDFSNYLSKHLKRIMNLFDFNNQDELRLFLSLDFNSDDFFKKYSDFDKTSAFLIVDKIKKSLPHEYQLVEGFFNGDSQVYDDYVLYDEFEGMSELDKLLHMILGVKEFGKEVQREGFKEYILGQEVFLTLDEAKTKYILNYFIETYQEKSR